MTSGGHLRISSQGHQLAWNVEALQRNSSSMFRQNYAEIADTQGIYNLLVFNTGFKMLNPWISLQSTPFYLQAYEITRNIKQSCAQKKVHLIVKKSNNNNGCSLTASYMTHDLKSNKLTDFSQPFQKQISYTMVWEEINFMGIVWNFINRKQI